MDLIVQIANLLLATVGAVVLIRKEMREARSEKRELERGNTDREL